MKLSARNVLRGRVVDIDKGKVTAIVRVDWRRSRTWSSRRAPTFTPLSKQAKCFSAWTT